MTLSQLLNRSKTTRGMLTKRANAEGRIKGAIERGTYVHRGHTRKKKSIPEPETTIEGSRLLPGNDGTDDQEGVVKET